LQRSSNSYSVSVPSTIPTNVTRDPSLIQSARGTYDPSLVDHNYGSTLPLVSPAVEYKNQRFTGAWIACPYALFDPNGYREAYLKPGKYDVEGDIILSQGDGCSFGFTLESTLFCYDLNIDYNTIKIELEIDD